jgi:NAD(P)-dependent dehydrogenase (short-subunit alcohol dehydrogenase family)
MKNIVITGATSGIGLGLAKEYQSRGDQVFTFARRDFPGSQEKITHFHCDITSQESCQKAVKEMGQHLGHGLDIDTVILNAGVLGNFEVLHRQSLAQLKQVFEVNLWGQKLFLDELLKQNFSIKHVIGISSGAAVNGNKGWGGYALSKAAFKMMIDIYAQEFPQTKFYSVAPGLVDTHMQEQIREVDSDEFPSVKRLHQAQGTESMPTPEQFAPLFIQKLPQVLKKSSGEFVDLRKLD